MFQDILKYYARPFFQHPLNRNQKWNAVLRFLKWQLRLRLIEPFELVAPFIEESRFIVKRGRTGLTGNLYSGLHEFNEMMFVLHFLRPEDTFFDVGANVGSYSILSAVCAGSTTHSFEPVPNTFELLYKNKIINHPNKQWRLINAAVGDVETNLLFSTDQDTTNRVVDESYAGSKTTVSVLRLDSYCLKNDVLPILLKVDAEGYDDKVIAGAKKILSRENVKAIIIEGKHPFIESELQRNGFKKFSYNPFTRELIRPDSNACNDLYVKNTDFCEQRLKSAKTYKILNYSI